MPNTLRARAIRLAHEMPVSHPGRRALLAVLQRTAVGVGTHLLRFRKGLANLWRDTALEVRPELARFIRVEFDDVLFDGNDQTIVDLIHEVKERSNVTPTFGLWKNADRLW